MIDRLFLTATVAAVLAVSGRAGAAPTVPEPFSVCVVTSDAEGHARLDSYHHDESDAKARRREILTVDLTWTTARPLPGPEQSQPDREYEYPRASLVKVFVDPTLVNESACMPPPVPVSDADADTAAAPRRR